MEADRRFAADFADLIRQQQLDDLDVFLQPLELFDEPPLYSRFDQLKFLAGLPVAEKNRQTIRAAVAHLARIVEHGRGHDSYCMLSIFGWHDFDDGGLLTPAFWNTRPSIRPDPEDPRGVLDYLDFEPPTSRYSAFVADALEHDTAYLIRDDSETDPCTKRVYVRLHPYWSDVYQTLR